MPLALDGHVTGTWSSGTSFTTTASGFSTTKAGDIIVAFVETVGSSLSVTSLSTPGVVWNGSARLRKAGGSGATTDALTLWYGTAVAALTNVTNTINLSGTPTHAAASIFGVSGGNTRSISDSNASLPASATGSGGTVPTVTGVSTTNPNTMLIAGVGQDANTTQTAGSGFTLIDSVGGTGFNCASEEQVVSSAQSSVSVAFGTSGASTRWFMIVDAIQIASVADTPPSTPPRKPWPSNAFARFLGNVWDTGVKQVETNPHTIGRFNPAQHVILSGLRQTNPKAQGTETNPHTPGKFTPTALNLWPQYRFNTTDSPPIIQPETNVHTPGRFQPTALNLWPQHRFHTDTAVSQPETNVHSIGKFTPANFTLLPGHRQNYPTADTVIETNVNFIGRFVPTALKLLPLVRQNLTSDLPRETNVHTPGRFAAPQLQHLPLLRQDYPTADVVAETNVHTIGKHAAVRFQLLPLLRTNYPTADTVVETNVHTPGRFAPTAYQRLIGQLQNQALDIPPAPADDPVHTLGRFQATIFARFRYNTWDTAVPQVETNPHMLGRFRPMALTILPEHRQAAGLDTPPTPPDDPTYTIGRFVSPQHKVLQQHRQNYPTADRAVEPNPHMLGRFRPAALTILPEHRQAASLDTPPVPPDDPTYTIGRFASLQHRLLSQHRQNYPTADFVVETNPHIRGRFAATGFRITPTHRQTVPPDAAAETNTNFLGRYLQALPTILKTLRQTVPPDIFVTPPDNPTYTRGRFEPTRYRILQALFGNPAHDIPPVPPPQFGMAFAYDFPLYLTPLAVDEHATAFTYDFPPYASPPIITEPGATCEATDSALWMARGSSMASATTSPNGPYQIESAIELQGSFTGANGQNADPTVVTLYLEDPSGNESSFTYPPTSGPIVRTGVGTYTYTFTATISGMWTYKWQGTGAVVATSADTQFEVTPSALIPG